MEEAYPVATVLIVDDHPDVCRVVSRLVRTIGHSAESAEGGELALAYLRDHIPDLVILDAMMPRVDGLQVLKSIRTDPRTRDVPVVMFSALSDPEFQTRAIKAGANQYWVKGNLNLDQLDQGITGLLPHQ
jgi:CheY-like chemotaxis protein